MIGRWYFVDAGGNYAGQIYCGDEDHLRINTPAGFTPTTVAPDHPTPRSPMARERIDGLESAQARPLRELALDPSNAVARKRLMELDAKIAELRSLL